MHRTHGGPNGFIEGVDLVDEPVDDCGAVGSALAGVFFAIKNGFPWGVFMINHRVSS